MDADETIELRAEEGIYFTGYINNLSFCISLSHADRD